MASSGKLTDQEIKDIAKATLKVSQHIAAGLKGQLPKASGT